MTSKMSPCENLYNRAKNKRGNICNFTLLA